MNKDSEWKQKLDTLKNYISTNREIYIDVREISIPEHLRTKFYELFDDIRNTFVEEFFASLPLDVDTLCSNYVKSEKEVMKALETDHIDLPVDLVSFLHNPREGMVRWLYNRLFEMIQEKITIEDFEEIAENDLVSTTFEMYQIGYEIWAIFTLITLLEPDETHSVELDDNFEPVPGKLAEIAFGRQFNHSTKRIPEIILHSKKLDSYVAVKFPLAREIAGYRIPPEMPHKMLRDRTGDTSYVLDKRIMFLSMIDSLDKIPVYAELDKRTIKSPDLMIEFLGQKDISDEDKISEIKTRLELMKPILGGTSVLIDTEAEQAEASLPEGMNIYSAGFDRNILAGIIDRLG